MLENSRVKTLLLNIIGSINTFKPTEIRGDLDDEFVLELLFYNFLTPSGFQRTCQLNL